MLAPAPPHSPQTASSGAPRRHDRRPARRGGRPGRGRARTRRAARARCASCRRSDTDLVCAGPGERAIAAQVSPSCSRSAAARRAASRPWSDVKAQYSVGPTRIATRPRPRVPLIHSICAWLPLTVSQASDELAFLVGELQRVLHERELARVLGEQQLHASRSAAARCPCSVSAWESCWNSTASTRPRWRARSARSLAYSPVSAPAHECQASSISMIERPGEPRSRPGSAAAGVRVPSGARRCR